MKARQALIERLEAIVGGPLLTETLRLIDDVARCSTCERRQQWAREYLTTAAKHTKEFYNNHP